MILIRYYLINICNYYYYIYFKEFGEGYWFIFDCCS